MRVQTFKAKTLQQALSMVRKNFGDDALIVDTKDVNGFVEVTATLDQFVMHNFVQPSFKAPDHQFLRRFDDLLEKHHFDHLLIEQMKEYQKGTNRTVQLNEIFKRILHFEHDFLTPTHRLLKPLVVAGPYGAGKTTAIAKLASRFIDEGQNVTVLTCDIQKTTAFIELRELLRPLKIYPYMCDSYAALEKHTKSDGNSVILIDTPGLNINEEGDLDFLRGFQENFAFDVCLLLQAGLDYRESIPFLEALNLSNPPYLAFSQMDICHYYKNIVQLPWAYGCSLSFFTFGPYLDGGLDLISPEILQKCFEEKNACAEIAA